MSVDKFPHENGFSPRMRVETGPGDTVLIAGDQLPMETAARDSECYGCAGIDWIAFDGVPDSGMAGLLR